MHWRSPRCSAHSASAASTAAAANGMAAFAAGRTAHEPRARVGRVGDPFDVAGAFELVDEEPGGLL